MTLTHEEDRVVQRINSYFRSPKMSLRDKVFNAKLIAVHDLESENFVNDTERQRLTHYTSILDNIMQKLDA